jgi:hypothetical protein
MGGVAAFSTIFMLIYPFGVALVLLYSMTGYALFVRKIHRGWVQPKYNELDMLGELTIGKRTPRLIKSTYATTPMLIGIFKPIIVLPDSEYSSEHLHGILLHELTHMRRFDVVVKWLSLFSCAVHWFNPLVWITRREIDRACELACDEVVIRGMDANNKQNYGETLIAVSSNKKIPLPVLSTTMCAEKKAIKERLGAIMKNKKHTKLAILVSSLILLTVALAACALGAASGGVDERTVPDSPRTVEDFALQHINTLTQELTVAVFPYGIDNEYFYVRPANIIDTPFVTYELHGGLSDILPSGIELWRLDFMVHTDDFENEYLRWGTFSPDAEGRVGHHTGWNDAFTILVFERNGDELEFLGNIPWWMEENPDGLPGAVQAFFEQEGISTQNNDTFMSNVISDGVRVFVLENMTDRELHERTTSVTLYADGTATIATPLIISFVVPGSPHTIFTIENNELAIYQNIDGDRHDTAIARFTVIDNDTLEFLSASVPMFADVGARYVFSPNGFDIFAALDGGIEATPFVGAAHETQRIVNAMPLPRGDMSTRSIQIGADHGGFGYAAYTLTIHYGLYSDAFDVPGAAFERISARLFDLIENLQAVTFSVGDYKDTDLDNYIYRWSISRISSDVGGGAVTSFRGTQEGIGQEPIETDVVAFWGGEFTIASPLRTQPSLENTVSMSVTGVDAANNQMFCTIFNESDYELLTGFHFMVEYFDGTDWRIVPWHGDFAGVFHDIGFNIEPHDSLELTLNLDFVEPLQTGLHRMRTIVFRYVDTPIRGDIDLHDVTVVFNWE